MSMYQQTVNKDSSKRVYQKIAAQLETEVRHQYTPGECLPSESCLAARFRVNRHTVRRAMDELVAVGLIRRHQGKGSIVQRQPGDYLLNGNAHFSGNLASQGKKPGCQVLESKRIHAPRWLAGCMGIEPESCVILIRTLRHQDDIPRSIIDHYLPDRQWWQVLKYFREGSLHQFMNKELGIELQRKTTRLSARNPTREEAKVLDIPESTPLIKIKTINVIKDSGQVAEYSISCTRSDVIELVMEHS